jgi:toxin HigB-1
VIVFVAFDKCDFTLYKGDVIVSFRHRGLKRLFERDDPSRVHPQHGNRIRQILALLDVAQTIEDVDIHPLRLHPLTGDLKGHWSVTVRANWRIVFRFEDGDVFDVDLVDYH